MTTLEIILACIGAFRVGVWIGWGIDKARARVRNLETIFEEPT